jgi:hypothetical protein
LVSISTIYPINQFSYYCGNVLLNMFIVIYYYRIMMRFKLIFLFVYLFIYLFI